MQGDEGVAFRSEILIKLDKKGRALLPAAFRDELPADDRGAFVLYHSPNLPGVVNGNSRAGFDSMLDRLRDEALGPKGALKVALDDEAFDPAGYLSASARTVAMEPDGRFSMPAEFAGALEIDEGVMLVGKGDKFQLWNPGRWQQRREADRAKMAAFVRGLANSDSARGDA
ncbi:division/cell wall cluster transcriptional repressor MraZ [soil metagenome]